MRVLVCLKQIPEIEAVVLDTAGALRFGTPERRRLERYGEHALELALQLAEAADGHQVDVLTVGPESAREALVRALGMGATHGIHVRVADDEAAADAALVASEIAVIAGERKYDLILCGVMSEDRLQGQVGPRLAARLGWPWTTNAIQLTASGHDANVEVSRELEGGWLERLALERPAVVTVQSSGGQPRYPRLSLLLAAKDYDFEVVDGAGSATDAGRLLTVGLSRPVRRREGRQLPGSPRQQAAELVRLLRQRGLLRERGAG